MARLSDENKIDDEEFLSYKKRQQKIAWLKSIVVYILFISGLLALYENDTFTIKRITQYFNSTIEAYTSGEILKSRSIRVGRYWKRIYFIEYDFLVDKKKYTGNLVDYKHPSNDVDKKVKVYYDESNPRNSFLQDSYLGFDYWFFLIFVPLVSPLIVWGGYHVFYKWV